MQTARTRSKSRAKAEINVVPYIDVMLVLLVIFIATVDKAGQYYVSIDTTSEKMGSLDELTAYVSSQLQKDPSRPVVVQGDAQVAYDNVIQLMNALKNGGVKSVGLVTEPINSN